MKPNWNYSTTKIRIAALESIFRRWIWKSASTRVPNFWPIFSFRQRSVDCCRRRSRKSTYDHRRRCCHHRCRCCRRLRHHHRGRRGSRCRRIGRSRDSRNWPWDWRWRLFAIRHTFSNGFYPATEAKLEFACCDFDSRSWLFACEGRKRSEKISRLFKKNFDRWPIFELIMITFQNAKWW